MDKYPPDAWQRLGKMLQERRGQLGYGYRQRGRFLQERGGLNAPSGKMLSRLENGKFFGFPDETIAALERLYGYEPGSFEAILRGSEPVPVNETPAGSSPRPMQPVLRAVPSPDSDTDPAESLLAALVKEYGEGDDQDSNVVRLLANQLGHGKPAATIVREIREWLRVIGLTERNGTSA